MTTKKILIYSTAYYPLVGGAEVAIRELTDRLPDWDFELITARLNRSYPKQEQIGRVLVHRVGFGFNFDKIILALWGGHQGNLLHRQAGFSAVWSVMASYSGFAALDFKKLQPQVPYLLTLQEGDDLAEVERKVKFVHHRFLQIFKQADYVQVISNYLADWAKRMEATAPIEVIPNGVDLNKFNPLRQLADGGQKSRIKNGNAGTGEKIIISASRLVKKNGLSDLILALKFLPENIKLQLLGEGPERPNLENLVKANHLESRVDFVGFVLAEKILNYYQSADVFCRPSLTEGLGNAFLEAMAAGLPVAATPVGGIPDFLIDNETGFLTPIHNPEALANRLAFVLDPANQALVERVAHRAKSLVEEKYDWARIALRFDALFKRLAV